MSGSSNGGSNTNSGSTITQKKSAVSNPGASGTGKVGSNSAMGVSK
jgi:hypothetical protein